MGPISEAFIPPCRAMPARETWSTEARRNWHWVRVAIWANCWRVEQPHSRRGKIRAARAQGRVGKCFKDLLLWVETPGLLSLPYPPGTTLPRTGKERVK